MTEATTTEFRPNYERVRVWDIWVRLFHWSLVASITVAAWTGFMLDASWIALHIAAGLVATALVVARVVWGFFGPTHARFRDFLRPPSEVFAHLTGADHKRHLGHNPAGGVMMVALMGAVVLLAFTGLAGLGGVLRTGPLVAIPFAIGDAALEAHEAVALLLLAMIVAHVAGAVFESRRSGENLVASMVTGTKENRPGDHASPELRPRPLPALLVFSALAGVTTLALPRGTEPLAGAPVAALDSDFEEECTACHLAYHPSLLSGEEWRELMAGLDDHYGEDASLDAETTARITDWLVARAAGAVQSRPANLFGGALEDPDGSLTDTRAWKHLHEDIPGERFQRAPIYSASNCSACHGDAEAGWFSPFHINIPKETAK